MKLEITPQDLAPVNRVQPRLDPPRSEKLGELQEILAELRSINERIRTLAPRVRHAMCATVDQAAEVKMSEILKFTSDHFQITQIDILSTRRSRNVVRPRQYAMYLCRTLTVRTYSEIGRFFGDRDHTTVFHGVNLTIHLMDQDKKLSEEIRLLADEILKAAKKTPPQI